MSRYVPKVFTATIGNDGLNNLLHQLAAIFPRSETQPNSNGIRAEATTAFRAYLEGIDNPLTTARRLLSFQQVAFSEEWCEAISSSLGMMVSTAWFEEVFPIEFAIFLQKNSLSRCLIEERGPSWDRETGCAVTSPDGRRIVYLHPRTSRVYAGQRTIVPLVPPEGTKYLRTQPNGTEVYELELR